MTDEALLGAILASPDDDVPRLIYADWLDDRGDAARAEFIRVQVEYAIKPSEALAWRNRELLDAHKPQWIIPELRAVQEFHRGFVRSLQITAEEFVLHAARIGRLAPVSHLRLPVAVDHLASLAEVPWLARLTHLDLTGNVGLGSRLDEFFGAAELPGLQSLEMRNCQLWPEQIGTLGQLAGRWPLLKRLNLSGNPIGDDGARRLGRATAFHKLEELILRCDEQQEIDSLSELGAIALEEDTEFERLTVLDLDGHYLGDDGFRAILSLLRRWPMKRVDLSYNEVGRESQSCYQDLAFQDRPFEIQQLTLDGNRLTAATLNWLTLWPGMARIGKLSIRDCDVGPEAKGLIARSPWRDHFIVDEDYEAV